MSALHNNNTWELVKKPNGVPIVDSRWIYKVKRNINGEVKYKARLVARGFSQRYAVNYWETYAPVVKCATIRMLLSLAINEDMIVEQIDVKNAYIKSDLKECIYMKQPRGFEKGDYVCKLNKSLYGLKQAGHEWNQCLNNFLTKELEYMRLASDPCVYTRKHGDEVIIICVYVDDILILCRDQDIIDEFKEEMDTRFGIEDIGECQRIIGIKVEQQKDRIRITQEDFIRQLIEDYGLADSRTEKTPVNTALELVCLETSCDGCDLIDGTTYRALIGKLLYIAGSTRPDVAFAISSLSRFNSNPHRKHWEAAKRVIKYLKGTIDSGIEYRRNDVKLYGHSDADWANCRADRKSYTGFIIFIGGSPVSWEARKQPTVALSTTEAEYMAITSAAKEMIFCSRVLRELGFRKYCETPLKLYSDNMGAIKLSSNIGFSSRTKHIDTRHHFVRELVQEGLIELEHVGTEDALADICTKGLNSVKHFRNMDRIMYCK